VVPFTRGPEVHRPADHIVEEVKRLVDSGVVEVTLLGQTVNHYAYSDGGKTTSFADLLWQIHEQVPDLPRLRFLTSYPRDFTDDALDAMAAADRICKYLHIPVQSGSNRILKKMNRGYTVEEYFGLLERARKRMPNIRLAGDMIVGFPTETDEDHEMSMELLRQAQYKSCFIFKYSPRPGTVSIRRLEDDVPDPVKKARNKALLDLQGEISYGLHQSYEGQILPVLVENESKFRKKPDDGGLVQLGWAKSDLSMTHLVGRTEGDEIVAFEGPRSLIGTITPVEAVGATPLTIQGRWTPDPLTSERGQLGSRITEASL
jgi:tRNA-2-methylthio-N6-dimethylallyladenosine synthase